MQDYKYYVVSHRAYIDEKEGSIVIGCNRDYDDMSCCIAAIQFMYNEAKNYDGTSLTPDGFAYVLHNYYGVDVYDKHELSWYDDFWSCLKKFDDDDNKFKYAVHSPDDKTVCYIDIWDAHEYTPYIRLKDRYFNNELKLCCSKAAYE